MMILMMFLKRENVQRLKLNIEFPLQHRCKKIDNLKGGNRLIKGDKFIKK